VSEKEPLDRATLLDLFKHWDTRVSHQELLFVPLSVAGFPAVAATWDEITFAAVFFVATGSIGLYVYHLLAIQRLGMFQDKIFDKLGDQFADFDEVVDGRNCLGIRRLRLFGLPVLGVLWAGLLDARMDSPFLNNMSRYWWAAALLLVGISLFTTFAVWAKTPAEN
jgi:hypothetical protein